MAHTRAKLCLDTVADANAFVKEINSDGSTEKWMLENFEGNYRVSARSLLGVIYAVTEWSGEIYLVDETQEEREFPSFIDKYRA